MRVLWVDADGNPWTDSNGWRVLEDFGLDLQRIATTAEAQKELSKKEFDLILIRAELKDAPSLLVQARRVCGKDGRKVVLASSEWSKEQFRVHSKTEGAAHRYARVPMPPEGFLNLVADLFGCAIEEFADFAVSPEENIAEDETPKPAAKAKKSKKTESAGNDANDMDVLRKYLAIREEQLEISDGEREELASENERLQKEAHQLQLKLREFEHMHDELSKKIEQMESDRAESDRILALEKEEAERNNKLNSEKVKGLEAQMADAGEKYENLRSRVRKDIRKIRENERDLEARLELARKDSETLLQARDVRVLELQRKIDALEFDLDQVQDSRVQAQMEAERYLAKLSRVSRALQVANHMIEDDRASDSELEELEPEEGGAANAEDSEPGAGAELPPSEEANMEAENLSPDLAALANDGEATQMIDSDGIQKIGGESGSSG